MFHRVDPLKSNPNSSKECKKFVPAPGLVTRAQLGTEKSVRAENDGGQRSFLYWEWGPAKPNGIWWYQPFKILSMICALNKSSSSFMFLPMIWIAQGHPR